MAGESTRSAHSYGSGSGLASSGVLASSRFRQTAATSSSPAGATLAAMPTSAGRSAQSATAAGALVWASDSHRAIRCARPIGSQATERLIDRYAGRVCRLRPHRPEGERRRRDGGPGLDGKSVRVLPRDDRIVQARPADLAGGGGDVVGVGPAAYGGVGVDGGGVHRDEPLPQPGRGERGERRPARSGRAGELDLDRQAGLAKRLDEADDLGHPLRAQHGAGGGTTFPVVPADQSQPWPVSAGTRVESQRQPVDQAKAP